MTAKSVLVRRSAKNLPKLFIIASECVSGLKCSILAIILFKY